MNRKEFDKEWYAKITGPYLKTEDDIGWHHYASRRVHVLTTDAKDFILLNDEVFGDWLLEALAGYALEKSLALEHEDASN